MAESIAGNYIHCYNVKSGIFSAYFYAKPVIVFYSAIGKLTEYNY